MSAQLATSAAANSADISDARALEERVDERRDHRALDEHDDGAEDEEDRDRGHEPEALAPAERAKDATDALELAHGPSVRPRQAIGLGRLSCAPVSSQAAIAPPLQRILAERAHDERDRRQHDEEDEREENARIDEAERVRKQRPAALDGRQRARVDERE